MLLYDGAVAGVMVVKISSSNNGFVDICKACECVSKLSKCTKWSAELTFKFQGIWGIKGQFLVIIILF